MNSLEKYISDNKTLFEEDPVSGHFERFKRKLSRKQGRKTFLRRLSMAASITILLSVGIGTFWQLSVKQEKNQLCENAVDMKICFANKMNILADEIEELIKDFDRYDKQTVMEDVQNILDSINDGFENELPEELPENITKEILADYYRQNLEGLEMIVGELRKIVVSY